jgi:hypothetical protein
VLVVVLCRNLKEERLRRTHALREVHIAFHLDRQQHV